MADQIQRIVAQLEAEDNASPELRRTRQESIELAKETQQVIRQFTRLDNHSAALAKNIKSIRDPALRARLALRSMKGAASSTSSTLDRLEDRITLVRIKLDEMGAAGTLVRKGMAGLAIAAAGAAVAVAAFARNALQAFISQTVEAERSANALSAAWEGLQAQLVETTLGGGQSAIDNLDTLTGLLLLMNRALESGAVTIPPWAKELGLMAISSQNATFRLGLLNKDVEDVEASFAHAREEGRRFKEAQDFVNESLRDAADAAKAAKNSIDELKETQTDRDFSLLIEGKLKPRGRGGGRRRQKRRKGSEAGIAAEGDFINRQILQPALQVPETISGGVVPALDKMIATMEGADLAAFSANYDLALDVERQKARIQTIEEMRTALEGLANGGIMVVTDAMGGMIESLAAGEFRMGNFARGVLGAFGDLFSQVGKGMIAMGTAGQLIQSGGIISSPLAGIAVGAALVAIGSAMKGFSKRGAGAGGDAAAAVTSSVAGAEERIGRQFNRDRDEGPRETVIVIGEREVRGLVVDTVNQGVQLGEIPLVPAGGV